MISFLNLGSGSKGNATLIYNDDTLILVDVGLSLKVVQSGLDAIGRKLRDINAIFITHDHTDHICGLSRLFGVAPIYAGKRTIGCDHCSLTPRRHVSIGSFEVTCLKTSHDAPDSVGYLLKDSQQSLLYMTDTGVVPKTSLPFMKNCDYYIFESNHDLDMLMASRRPMFLKERIAGRLGHLSNRDSASILSSVIGPKTKGIYLAHLSEECNNPGVALKTYREVFAEAGISLPDGVIRILKQWEWTFGGAS